MFFKDKYLMATIFRMNLLKATENSTQKTRLTQCNCKEKTISPKLSDSAK